MKQGASARQLAIYYVLLAVAIAVVTIVVVGAGEDKKAQPPIAGGYDVERPNACLGPSFDVTQSGQFVNLSNLQGTLGGKLRLEEQSRAGAHPLSGDVSCVDGRRLEFEGTARSGDERTIEGRLGGERVAADLKRDPPEPGAAKPRAPGSIAGLYKLSPRSTCFGGKFELEGSGSSYTLKAREQEVGALAYDQDTGTLGGDVECGRGEVRLKAQAIDRNLNNVALVPLDRPVEAGPHAHRAASLRGEVHGYEAA